MRSVFFHTFGCRVNQYETESLRQKLAGIGYAVADGHERADLCVINSCSVTAEADRKCRQFVRRVLRENAKARVLVTGCYATRDPEEVRRISPRIEVFSNQEKDLIPEAVAGCSLGAEDSPLLNFFAGRTRAFVKVQDGCDATCTYCIIPKVRPQMMSRPIAEIKAEVENLIAHGYKEVVLTGIRLGSYGLASSGGRVGKIPGNLADLLRKLIEIPDDFRIRLSSLEITEVTDELLSLLQQSEKICPSFHLPLQSGDDDILKRMGRWYDTHFYSERMQKIREKVPHCGVTADVIVGFPDETETRFENTFSFIEQHLNGLHVFPFSDRAGTAAVKLPGHQPWSVVQTRVERLLALDKKLRNDFAARFAGTERKVLMESNGGFTDNGIRLPSSTGHPEGAFVLLTVPGAAAPQMAFSS